jgi:serine/threonine-protein kinase
MLVGKYPFEANTAWEWASKHMTEPPRPIETQPLGDHVPLAMRNAISRALAKNKDERFASVKEFYEAFAGSSSAQHTAAMGAAAAASAGGNPAALAPSEPGGRPKTEMAQPIMGGGPPAGAVTPPPYGPGPGGPAIGTPAPHGAPAASVPQGPMHSPAKKGGGSGLVIGLAVLAVLLIGGGVTAYALRGKPKPVPTTTLADLSGSPSTSAAPVESATAAPPDDPAAAAATTDPLGGTTVAAATSAKSGAGTTPPGPKTTPIPSPKPNIPTPTPKPPAVDPAVCAAARSAAKRGSPAAAGLANQCRAQGGTL